MNRQSHGDNAERMAVALILAAVLFVLFGDSIFPTKDVPAKQNTVAEAAESSLVEASTAEQVFAEAQPQDILEGDFSFYRSGTRQAIVVKNNEDGVWVFFDNLMSLPFFVKQGQMPEDVRLINPKKEPCEWFNAVQKWFAFDANPVQLDCSVEQKTWHHTPSSIRGPGTVAKVPAEKSAH